MAKSILKHPLVLENFGMLQICAYGEKLSDIVRQDFNLFTETRKGLLMFREKFVSGISYVENETGVIIISKVKAEMRKSVVYEVSVTISSNNEIVHGICSCPAGQQPSSCKHTFATLYALDHYSTNKLYSAPTEVLQKWHQPKTQKFEPMKCSEVFGKPKAQQPCTQLDYSVLINGTKPLQLLSVLNYDFSKYTPPLPACALSKRPESPFPPLPPAQLLFIVEHLKFKIEDIWDMEAQTVQQSGSTLWAKERSYRLTATSFHNIFVRVNNFESLAKNLFDSKFKDISFIPAVAHGINSEPMVRNFVRNMYPTSVIRKVGLVLNPFMPHLGASPDGMIHDSDITMLLEIKSLYNVNGKTLEELAASRPNFCLETSNHGWKLKKTHSYYFQVQGQLAITNLTECLFVLFYKNPNYVYTEIICFDVAFWENVYPKLTDFYFKYYLPLLTV